MLMTSKNPNTLHIQISIELKNDSQCALFVEHFFLLTFMDNAEHNKSMDNHYLIYLISHVVSWR